MRYIIDDGKIERIVKEQKFEIDDSHIIEIHEQELKRSLYNYLFLKQYIDVLHNQYFFTFEELLYSQYYWFLHFKKKYGARFGSDAGMEQQAFQLLESLTGEMEEIDWGLIEEIESLEF